MSIEVTFELVTPAYAGGADRQKTDGLRPPTLKALLRFWWRTMHPDLPPNQLHEQEAQLFGSSGEATGQGMRLVPRGPWPNWQKIPAGTHVTEDWHIYAAYGAVAWSREAQKQVTQIERLNPSQSIRAALYPPHRLSSADEVSAAAEEMRRTLWLLSAFGGIGSRSCRSWGSLRVVGDLRSNLADVHADAAGAEGMIAEGLGYIFSDKRQRKVSSAALPFTGFTADTRLLMGPVKTTWSQAAEAACSLYHTYRKRLGKNRNGGGAPGPDYTKFTSLLSGSKPVAFEGLAFGAPNNRESRTSGGRVDAGVGPDMKGRRASPLFLKVIGSGTAYRPVALWLPAEYLPHGMGLHMSTGRKASWVADPGSAPIQKFFDGRVDVNPVWNGLVHESGWTEVTW